MLVSKQLVYQHQDVSIVFVIYYNCQVQTSLELRYVSLRYKSQKFDL